MSKQGKKINLDVKEMLVHWPAVGYDAHENNSEVRDFYAKMEGVVSDKFGFFAKKKLTDIFIFAMLLGKHEGLTEDYIENKKGRKSSINAIYFADNPNYVWMMIAVALDHVSKNDPKRDVTELVLPENSKEIVEICEKYANHGIHELIRMHKEEGVLGYENKLRELVDEQ